MFTVAKATKRACTGMFSCFKVVFVSLTLSMKGRQGPSFSLCIVWQPLSGWQALLNDSCALGGLMKAQRRIKNASYSSSQTSVCEGRETVNGKGSDFIKSEGLSLTLSLFTNAIFLSHVLHLLIPIDDLPACRDKRCKNPQYSMKRSL